MSGATDSLEDTGTRQWLAAILAADAEGYARLMAADDRATISTLDSARAVFRAQIESNQGRVIDMAGDSVLAVFEAATGAVSAALSVQRDLQAGAATAPADQCMRFRIGVHLGDVIEKADGTVYGDGVNIAARLQGLAEPGGILVSASVYLAVLGKLAADFEDQGEQVVKNIALPVHVYRARAFDAAPTATEAGNTAGACNVDQSNCGQPTIAVLPFTNMTTDPAQECFTDGLTEDIITGLSRFHSLSVMARNSSFAYKGQSPDVRLVGRELGVRYVVEGSFRRSGDQIRVTAHLIDALTGIH
ncbi:MAG: adenylate/guanylate cyclase domain-containing protein, partial [Rhodoferax sp.]|nr:adenylate/guanylate cyclase domain-containing protein [Rhodoferax sp.]